MIEEKGRRHYVLITDFNTFIYHHAVHCRKNNFCRYCLQAFSTEEISTRQIKDCFEINGKQKFIMTKKVNMLNSKTMEEK